MSIRKRLGRSSSNRAKDQNTSLKNVGYAKPPRAHQFKPGRSGNPRGRPKGVKNEATILRDLLNRKINVREGGNSRKISILEAILLRFTEDALKGNVKTAAFLFNRYATTNAIESPTNDVSEDDRKVLDAFVRRLEAKRRTKREKSHDHIGTSGS